MIVTVIINSVALTLLGFIASRRKLYIYFNFSCASILAILAQRVFGHGVIEYVFWAFVYNALLLATNEYTIRSKYKDYRIRAIELRTPFIIYLLYHLDYALAVKLLDISPHYVMGLISAVISSFLGYVMLRWSKRRKSERNGDASI